MANKTVAQTITLEGVVLSFPKVFKAEAFKDGDKPRYSTTLLFDPGSGSENRIKSAMKAIVAEAWEGKKPNGLEVCLKSGDEKVATARNPENYDMYEGKMYVTAGCGADTPPVIVDSDGRTPLTAASGKIYGGAIVNAVVRLWSQDNKWGVRINCELKALQWRGKGVPFGSGGPIDPSAYFSELPVEEAMADEWDS